jgi:D-alanyl-D-alanine carboxypeptidase
MELTMKRQHTFRTAVLVAVLACAATALTSATALGNERSSLQSDVNQLVAAGAPGAILLVHAGNQDKVFTGGLADVTRRTPIRASDHFKIASLTKSYTATVVLQLVAERKLRLSDTVERWQPGLVPNGREITIRELLNHTSGIPEFDNDPRYLKPYLTGHFSHYWSPRQLVRIAVAHKPTSAPGATRSSYSNTNYVLLGLIVEAATGKSIGAELRERIFRPLRLLHTNYATKPGLRLPYAHGYLQLGKPTATDVTGMSPSLSPASGAIVSTAADVASFYRALLGGRLVTPTLLKAMTTTIPERGKTDIPGQRYGFGLERFPTPCGPALGHNGVIPGYTTYIYSSANGLNQALLMVNDDSTSLPKHAATLFIQLIGRAYCSTKH